MRLVIAGSRDLILTPKKLDEYFNKFRIVPIDKVTEVVSGCAKGIDKSGEDWAETYDIPVKQFPAEWKRFGKAAGPIRNFDMANYADAAALFINNNSRGTTNMLEHMVRLRKPFVCMNFSSYLSEEEYVIEPLEWFSFHDDKWEEFWHVD